MFSWQRKYFFRRWRKQAILRAHQLTIGIGFNYILHLETVQLPTRQLPLVCSRKLPILKQWKGVARKCRFLKLGDNQFLSLQRRYEQMNFLKKLFNKSNPLHEEQIRQRKEPTAEEIDKLRQYYDCKEELMKVPVDHVKTIQAQFYTKYFESFYKMNILFELMKLKKEQDIFQHLYYMARNMRNYAKQKYLSGKQKKHHYMELNFITCIRQLGYLRQEGFFSMINLAVSVREYARIQREKREEVKQGRKEEQTEWEEEDTLLGKSEVQ